MEKLANEFCIYLSVVPYSSHFHRGKNRIIQ